MCPCIALQNAPQKPKMLNISVLRNISVLILFKKPGSKKIFYLCPRKTILAQKMQRDL
jgi:hypothetical protein